MPQVDAPFTYSRWVEDTGYPTKAFFKLLSDLWRRSDASGEELENFPSSLSSNGQENVDLFPPEHQLSSMENAFHEVNIIEQRKENFDPASSEVVNINDIVRMNMI